MPNRAKFILVVLFVTVASVGCAPVDTPALPASSASSVADDLVSNSPEAINAGPAETSFSPPVTTPPSVAPVEEAGIGTSILHVQHDDGYLADVTVTWQEGTDMTSAEAASSCLKDSLPSATDYNRLAFKEIKILVSVDYPEVNGFVWPSGVGIPMRFSHGEDNGAWGTTCAPQAYWETLFSVGLPRPGDTNTVEYSKIYHQVKTPNNPEGAFDLDFKNLTFGVDGYYLQSCTVTGAENLGNGIQGPSCVIAYPGS